MRSGEAIKAGARISIFSLASLFFRFHKRRKLIKIGLMAACSSVCLPVYPSACLSYALVFLRWNLLNVQDEKHNAYRESSSEMSQQPVSVLGPLLEESRFCAEVKEVHITNSWLESWPMPSLDLRQCPFSKKILHLLTFWPGLSSTKWIKLVASRSLLNLAFFTPNGRSITHGFHCYIDYREWYRFIGSLVGVGLLRQVKRSCTIFFLEYSFVNIKWNVSISITN